LKFICSPLLCVYLVIGEDSSEVASLINVNEGSTATIDIQMLNDKPSEAAETVLALPGRVSVLEVSPYPHTMREAGKQSHRAQSSCILTGTPNKNMLKEKESHKTVKKRKLNLVKKGKVSSRKKTERASRPKSVMKSGLKTKMTERRQKSDLEVDKAADDTTPCLGCEIPYNESFVRWWQCHNCNKWACDECARIGKKKKFCCDNCQ
jgi:hypothetical protein